MTHSADSQLWDAYRQTTFLAATPIGQVAIRVGESSAEVDVLLRRHNAKEWAFITAYNPASQLMDKAENQKRHANLEDDIRERGFVYFHGQGIGTDPAWQPEVSLLIFGLDPEAAIQLGAKYGQNAIVYGKLERAAELLDCR